MQMFPGAGRGKVRIKSKTKQVISHKAPQTLSSIGENHV